MQWSDNVTAFRNVLKSPVLWKSDAPRVCDPRLQFQKSVMKAVQSPATLFNLIFILACVYKKLSSVDSSPRYVAYTLFLAVTAPLRGSTWAV